MSKESCGELVCMDYIVENLEKEKRVVECLKNLDESLSKEVDKLGVDFNEEGN